jgi:predicted SAM-dependent methyltransferase
MFKLYYWLVSKMIYSYHHRLRKEKNLMKKRLIMSGKMRWLDVGSSTLFSEGFFYSDILPIAVVPDSMKERYFQIDFSKEFTPEIVQKLGKFDFVRMQHVFEHFCPEDGSIVLKNIFNLLNDNGYLLITVPDLRKFTRRYLTGTMNSNWSFKNWAITRIEKEAPQSFYFSIFTHSVPHQAHLWCYDYKGLKYQLNRSVKYSSIKRIRIFNKLANIPFTHNRPLEDLCLLIQK